MVKTQNDPATLTRAVGFDPAMLYLVVISADAEDSVESGST